MELWAHEHTYERLWPVYGDKVGFCVFNSQHRPHLPSYLSDMQSHCFVLFFLVGVQWKCRSTLCEPQGSSTHYHRLCCKCQYITGNGHLHLSEHVLYTVLSVQLVVSHTNQAAAVTLVKSFLMWWLSSAAHALLFSHRGISHQHIKIRSRGSSAQKQTIWRETHGSRAA